MKPISQKLHLFAPVILRIGVALIFLWFGASQISDPTSWVAYVPGWAAGLVGGAGVAVFLNGAFEILLGSALLLGFQTRWVAFLLAFHMFDIAFIVGLDATGVRDLGIAIATTAAWLHGADWFTLDRVIGWGRYSPSFTDTRPSFLR